MLRFLYTRTTTAAAHTLTPLPPSTHPLHKLHQSLHIISTNAVIDGAVKFAPGTVFQQPPNTKSQTLLGCFKNGVPLHDFVLGGERAAVAKKERELEMDDRQVCVDVCVWVCVGMCGGVGGFPLGSSALTS